MFKNLPQKFHLKNNLMFLFLFGVNSYAEPIRCMHDFYASQELRQAEPEPIRHLHETEKQKETPAADLPDDQLEPLNIHFYYDSSFSPEELKVVKVIFNNLKSYLDFIQVKKFEQGNDNKDFSVSSPISCNEAWADGSNLGICVGKKITDENTNTIALAGSVKKQDQTQRPIKGYIMLGTSKLKQVIHSTNATQSDYWSLDKLDRSYMLTCLHEINHILSFSRTLFPYWITPDGSSAIAEVRNDILQKNQTFLTTKRLKNWVRERFFVNEADFENYGLEIEDNGGEATAGSHPNSRLYFTDLMQGVTWDEGYISPIFFYSLEDSGWYKLNHTKIESKIETLNFLDVILTTEDEHPNEALINQPAMKVYPRSYRGDLGPQDKCMPSYRSIGTLQKAVNQTVIDDITHNPWYDPLNISIFGNESTLDYAYTYLPAQNCYSEPKPFYQRHSFEHFGEDSMCVMSTLSEAYNPSPIRPQCYQATCGEDDRIEIIVNNHTVKCSYTGQKHPIPGAGGVLTCPPGKAACSNWKNKKHMIILDEVIPSSGPKDGQNLVAITGKGYDKYPDLSVKIGDKNCSFINRTDTRLLLQVEGLGEAKSVDVVLSSEVGNLSTNYPGYYTFVSMDYAGKQELN